MPATATAYDFYVDGIYYYINEDGASVSVTSPYNDSYSYYTSISIPEIIVVDTGEDVTTFTVTSIASNTFYGCENLTEIAIPNSVFKIGSDAFDGTAWYDNQPDGMVYAGLVAYKYKGEMENNANITLKEGTLGIADCAFSECSDLYRITIPNSVINIGNSAFANSTLTAMNYDYSGTYYLPTSLISIGRDAFADCHNIRIIHLPESLKTVGEYAFNNCYSLEEVTINGITEIPEGMFYECRKLKKVTFSNSVTSIGDQAFMYAGNSMRIGLPNSVTQIGSQAFSCASFGAFSLPDSIISIGSEAFSHTNLGYVNIPNSITSIGDWFVGCKRLNEVNIPNSVTSIGGAFEGCTALVNITLPNSVTSIYGTFSGCTALTNITLPNLLQFIGGSTFRGCKALANIIIPNSVQEIGEYAFDRCTALTNIIIPDSVQVIRKYAFDGCTNLERVSIGRGVNVIERQAFWGCENLSRVTSLATIPPNYTKEQFNYIFPETVYNQATLYVPAGSINVYQEAIDWKDFSKILEIDSNVPVINFADDNVKAICVQCWDNDGDGELSMEEAAKVTNLGYIFKNNTTITLFDELQYFTGLSSIEDGAFSNCSSLSSITIPNSVKSIGDEAFKGCSKLSNITIPNSVESIGNEAFLNCSKLTSMTIPNSVTSIGKSIFSGCSSMTSVTLSNFLSTISEGAFSGCKNLSSITIPNSVTQIDNMAFKDCTGLTKVNINDLAAWCRISFFNSYTSNPLRYARRLFLNDEEITNLEIPESITEIKQWAFYACSSFNSITIHKDVTSIADMAFSSCTGLTSVTCYAITPPKVGGSSVFTYSIIKDATLYVPGESVEVYSSKTPWKNFGSIVGIDEVEELTGDTNSDGVVNIADLNIIIDIILGGGNNAAADINGDGVVNISDINTIINIILK